MRHPFADANDFGTGLTIASPGPDPWLTLLLMVIVIGIVAISLPIALGGRRRGRETWVTALALGSAGVAVCYIGMAATASHIDRLIGMPICTAYLTLAVAVANTAMALFVLALVLLRADRLAAESATWQAEALRLANAELKATHREVVARLCAASEFRDDETAAHVTRMAHIAHRLALAAGCDAAFAEQLQTAAPLHDIGKIAIADAILFKPGPLSANEQRVMQQHANLGARILGGSELPLLKLAAEIAQSHHEKWDGSGYPNALAGEAIPLASRIVAVADVFDALLSQRPYKLAWSPKRVMGHMVEQAGKHFDPAIIDALQSNFGQILAIWLQHADSVAPRGRLVLVTHNADRPAPIATEPNATEPARTVLMA